MKPIKSYDWTELNHYEFSYQIFCFQIITIAPEDIMEKAIAIFIERQKDQDNVLNISDCLEALGYDSVVAEKTKTLSKS